MATISIPNWSDCKPLLEEELHTIINEHTYRPITNATKISILQKVSWWGRYKVTNIFFSDDDKLDTYSVVTKSKEQYLKENNND